MTRHSQIPDIQTRPRLSTPSRSTSRTRRPRCSTCPTRVALMSDVPPHLQAPPQTRSAAQGYDWVTLVAIPVLGVVACLALWLGNETVAGAAIGIIGGI